MSDPTKIIFLKVENSHSKLQQICTTIQKHFANKERILVLVPSDEAAIYIDKLLWRLPEESFLPHAIVNDATEEQVVITKSKNNINNAQILFNLCPENASSANGFAIVYELLDLTDAAKEQLSRKKLAAYQSAGLSVS